MNLKFAVICKPLIVFTILLSTLYCSAEEAKVDTILIFDRKNFSEWIYNKPDVKLTAQLINAFNVNFFNVNGVDYSLTSPIVDLTKYEKLLISMDFKTVDFDQSDFNKKDAAPAIVLLDDEDIEIQSVQLKLPTKTLLQNLSDSIILNPDIKNCKIKVYAPNGNLTSCGATSKILIKATEKDLTTAVPSELYQESSIRIVSDILSITNALNKSIKIISIPSGEVIENINKCDFENYNFKLNRKGIYGILINGICTKIIY